MTLTKSDLVRYMRNILGIDTAGLEGETLLFSTGTIDSFSMVSLLTFIEQHCGIQVDPDEITLENFDNIHRILKYAATKSEPTK